jgi:hypothetical protein
MNLSALEEKLMAAARTSVPSEHVPYAFEKRIMARVSDLQPPDGIALWASALWRSAASCVAVTLLLGTFAIWQGNGSSSGGDLVQDFESAVFVMADQSYDSW